jgi:hypothetical protein
MTETQLEEVAMSYEGLVDAGREARKQIDGHQWTEGDLALKVESLPSGSGPRDPDTGQFIEDAEQSLKRYAEDIDMSYGTLRHYRQTAGAWPGERRRSTVGYEVHRILATQPDRFDLISDGMTVSEARKIIRDRNAATDGHEPGWFELLGEVADTLIKAEKQLTRVEKAVTRKPKPAFSEKADGYAEIADDIAERLRQLKNIEEN